MNIDISLIIWTILPGYIVIAFLVFLNVKYHVLRHIKDNTSNKEHGEWILRYWFFGAMFWPLSIPLALLIILYNTVTRIK